jgi:hypothetical protein
MSAFPGEEEYQINEVIYQLNNVWRTEVNSSEILPFQSDLVRTIKESLDHQQQVIDERVDKKDETEFFTATLYQMDIERVRYSLSRYLRARVIKIEKSLEFIVGNFEVYDRLSDEEKVFASKLNTLNNFYFEDVVSTRLSQKAREYYELADDRTKHAEPSFQVCSENVHFDCLIYYVHLCFSYE